MFVKSRESSSMLEIAMESAALDSYFRGNAPFLSGISFLPNSLIAPSCAPQTIVKGAKPILCAQWLITIEGKIVKKRVTSSSCGVSCGRSAMTTPPPSSTSCFTFWYNVNLCPPLIAEHLKMLPMKSKTSVQNLDSRLQSASISINDLSSFRVCFGHEEENWATIRADE